MAVTCRDLHRALREGRPPSDAERAHAATCAACAELISGDDPLVRALVAAHAPDRSTDGAEAAARAERVWLRVQAERGWRDRPRRWSTPGRMAAVAATALGAFALVVAWVPRSDLWEGDAGLVSVLAVFGALLALGVGVRLWPLHRRPLPHLTVGVAATTLIAPVFLALSPAGAGAGDGFWSMALACFVFGSVLGAAVLVALEVVDRRSSVPVVQRVLSAGALGLAGNVALHLHCSITAPAHVLMGHGVLGLAWAVVLVALGTERGSSLTTPGGR